MEDLVLEEHLVLLDGLPDAHVLAVEGGHGALLAPLELGLGLGGVVGVVTVKVAIVVLVLTSVNGLLDLLTLFLLLLRKLLVQQLLFLLLLYLGHECTPRELDGHGALVDDLKVLVREEGDGGRLGVDVAFAQIDVVVVSLAKDRYLGLQSIVLERELFLVLAGLLWHK